MDWFKKPTTMEEVQRNKKMAVQAMIVAAVLLCVLMVAGSAGIASKLLSIAIGLLLGAGLVRWLQARKVEEEFADKAKKEAASPSPFSSGSMIDAAVAEPVNDQEPPAGPVEDPEHSRGEGTRGAAV